MRALFCGIFAEQVVGRDGASLASLAEGEPVLCNNDKQPLLLQHRATMAPLCCEAKYQQVRACS
jgi:hypothetical protein